MAYSNEEFSSLEESMDAAYLPEWATGLAHGQLVEGAQLCTRDGRRMGNAHIIQVGESKYDKTQPYYLIITDAGNSAILNANEITERFYQPKYISDVKRVIDNFWKNGEVPKL